jgi:integrase
VAKRGQGEGSIYKRKTDGRWAASVTLGYVNGKRKRKTFYGESRREVQEQLTAALRARQQGLLIVEDRQTVEQYLTRTWLPTVRQRIRPRAYENYDLNVRRILPYLGKIRLAALKPSAIQQCYTSLLEKGLKGHPLSRRSVEQAHTVLHAALRQALKWDMIMRNPADAVTVPRPMRREMKTLTADQALLLFDTSKGSRFHALWLLFATAALWMGEATALRWADVDLRRGTAVIQRALQHQQGAGLVFVEPKSASSRRTVHLAQVTVAALLEHRTCQVEQRLQLGEAWDDQDLIFPNETGGPIQPGHVRDMFHQALAQAGLPRIRPHDLRHTAATLLFEAGTHPKKVQELLGHSSILLTLGTYSHVLPSMHDEVATHMDELFNQSGAGHGISQSSEREHRS